MMNTIIRQMKTMAVTTTTSTNFATKAITINSVRRGLLGSSSNNEILLRSLHSYHHDTTSNAFHNNRQLPDFVIELQKRQQQQTSASFSTTTTTTTTTTTSNFKRLSLSTDAMASSGSNTKKDDDDDDESKENENNDLDEFVASTNEETKATLESKSEIENELSTTTLSPIIPQSIITDNDDDDDDTSNKEYSILLDTKHLPKLKPSIINRRLSKLKVYEGKETSIKQSPWKLNRICQLVNGLTVENGITQLTFCNIKNADLLLKLIRKTSNLADIKHCIQPSQLEIVQCFTTNGPQLKRIKFMGRGRVGRISKRYSHIRLILREIDFSLKIYQSKTINQKQKWLLHQQRANKEYTIALTKRNEMKRLLKEQEEKKLIKQKEQEKDEKAA